MFGAKVFCDFSGLNSRPPPPQADEEDEYYYEEVYDVDAPQHADAELAVELGALLLAHLRLRRHAARRVLVAGGHGRAVEREAQPAQQRIT